MSRILNSQTLAILKLILKNPKIASKDLYQPFAKSTSYKDFYNNLYRLEKLELIEKKESGGKKYLELTVEGEKTVTRFNPERDGVWKLVIFDIPEKQKYVRNVLRAKLKSLHFKKWQNSIWVSPYALDKEIIDELNQLSKKFFVRLIQTTEINVTDDLEKLF